jgi:caspase domain-containing protein
MMTGHRSESARRIRRLAILATAVALLGPGRPLVLMAMFDSSEPAMVGSNDRVQTGTDADGGRWSVAVDLTDEVSDAWTHGTTLPAVSPAGRHALIVGINNARGGRPLPGSVTDAKNLRDALLMYGFKRENITMLLDGAASRAAIRAGLDSLAQRTPTDGIAVFAVATHTRRHGGQNELLTADGLRISASELALSLGRVRSRLWTALPTCYSAGYALPGIVGPNRIATFASSADEPSYQLGEGGSFLILNMVRKAMIERQAPTSVEDAFRWARDTLKEESPSNVPTMSDGIPGELRLGRVPVDVREPGDPVAPPGWSYEARAERTTYTPQDGPEAPEGAPAATPAPGSDDGFGVCGSFQYRCDH